MTKTSCLQSFSEGRTS